MELLCQVELRYARGRPAAKAGTEQSQTHLTHIDFSGCRLHLELSLSSCTLSTHQHACHFGLEIDLKLVRRDQKMVFYVGRVTTIA